MQTDSRALFKRGSHSCLQSHQGASPALMTPLGSSQLPPGHRARTQPPQPSEGRAERQKSFLCSLFSI